MYEELKIQLNKTHDIAQDQKRNREDITWATKTDVIATPELLVRKKFVVEHDKLAELMYDWEHYFDTGYFVGKTPEQLQAAIVSEIDKINKKL